MTRTVHQRVRAAEHDGNTVEREALEFAGHLLVPGKWLRHAVTKYSSVGITVNDLAKIFGVSSDVIGYRLKQENIKLSSEWPKL